MDDPRPHQISKGLVVIIGVTLVIALLCSGAVALAISWFINQELGDF